MVNSGLYARSSPPGDDGTNYYRLEIGREDGGKPTPLSVVCMNIKVLEDLIANTMPNVNPKLLLMSVIESDYKLERVQEL